MKISLSNESITTLRTDLLALGVRSPKPARDPLLAKLDRSLGGVLTRCIKDEEFTGKKDEKLEIPAHGRVRARRLLLVGLGPDKDRNDESDARRLAVTAARAAKSRSSVALVATADDPASLRAAVEGAVNGSYQFTRYLTGKRKPKRKLGKAVILIKSAPTAADTAVVRQGEAVAEAVNLARDLINITANDMSPAFLADIAAEQCKAAGIACKVYDKKGVEKLGMPLLLAVNQGGSREPRFVHMTYKPVDAPKGGPRVVFVGKGLTFDSGGLCLKPPGSMMNMKSDMAGAAVTLGILVAAARLGLPLEVHGLIPSTDNMTGGNAYRPGDVFPSREGKTVEIVNTDAEGRLILADALAYAAEMKPDYLIDHATLTGACTVALGDYCTGLFCDDEPLVESYLKAAARTGEAYWRLPLDTELRDQLKSKIADIKHTGSRMGGAITAALFLKEFVGNSPWMHLDTAGPAFLDKPHGLLPQGGTGFGVLTAVRFLENLVTA